MAKTLLRDTVRKFRLNGASLKELSQRLKVPKSTVRYWCRDIVLSDRQQQRLFEKQKLGGIRAAERLRRQRILLTKQLRAEGMREIGKISRRERLLIGAALYWAEGYRKGDGEFGFTNADPNMAKFMLRWLRQACGVAPERIHLRICINAVHRRRFATVQKFWLDVTGIPISQFSKPTFIRLRSRKQYLNASEHFGTLRIKVRRSVNLRRKISGWIEGIARV